MSSLFVLVCSSPRRSAPWERLGEGGAAARPPLALDPEAAVARIVTVRAKLLRDRARRLRREQTAAEARLWDALRGERLDGWKWRRQVPVGPFIVDFACLQAKLGVEVDGGIHGEQADRDARRDAYLATHWLRVLRFWNAEVTDDLDRVLWTILNACRESEPGRRRKMLGHRR